MKTCYTVIGVIRVAELFETAVVSKRNVLNEIRSNNMTLQELRLFSIYLSKINPMDVSTRVVRFRLNDFQKIMGIGNDMNITHFRAAIRRILQQVVEVPNENGSGYRAFQLFKEAVVEKDEKDGWYVEFDAHDKALPLMFDFKSKYFKYELWNALRLKSPNQVRMYEILKQYEKVGKRELPVDTLRELLGISSKEYDRWDNFKRKVLDSCQQALKETTDICYTYERGRSGQGGKWLTIIFYIEKNTEYVDQITLEEFIDACNELQVEDAEVIDGQLSMSDEILNADSFYDEMGMEFESMTEEEQKETQFRDKSLAFLAEACNFEFDESQMRVIKDKLIELGFGKVGNAGDLERYEYLLKKYHELNAYQNIPKDAHGRRYGLMVKYLLTYV